MDITDHISYVRVSTGPQEESKEVQKEYIDQYLNSRGLSCSICYSETTSAYKGKQEAFLYLNIISCNLVFSCSTSPIYH